MNSERNGELVDGWVNGLVENQKRMLFLIEKKPNISKREMSEYLGISETNISKHIKSLKEIGVLKRIGSNKKGHWQLECSNDEHEGSLEVFAKNKGISDGVSDRLVENQKKMLLLIAKKHQISKRELSESIGISETNISKHLKSLREIGVLNRIGSNKKGHWQIARQNDEQTKPK